MLTACRHNPRLVYDYYWEPVPLRSEEQRSAGYSGGEAGQMARTLAICPAAPDYLALGIDTAEVYVSENGGESWQMRHEGILSNGIQSVCFDPGNPDVLYGAGFNDGLPVPGVEGIYRSLDTGISWALIHEARFVGRQAQNAYFAFDPASFDGSMHQTIYAVTYSEGLLRTTNGGGAWASLGFVEEAVNAVVLHPLNSDLLFVAADSGLYRSVNGGDSFDPVGAGLPAGAEVYGLCVDPTDVDILYVAARDDGLWKSTDGGDTLVPCMNGIPSWNADLDWCLITISPADSDYLYADANMAGGMFPYYSHDGGATWWAPSEREPGFWDGDEPSGSHYWMEGLCVHPTDPLRAYQATPVRRTTDGGVTWQYASDGISGFRRTVRTSVAFHPDDPNHFVFFHSDFGSARSMNGGDTFTYCPAPRQSDIGAQTMPVGAYQPGVDTQRLVSTVGGWTVQRICTSDDDGATWDVLPGTEGDYQFVAFSRQDPDLVYLGRASDSLRSQDGGVTWDDPLEYPIKAIFPGNGDVVYATREAAGGGYEVLRSDDRGDTWIPLTGTIHETFDVDVDPNDMYRVYAATFSGIWIHDGEEWSLRDDRHGLLRNQFGGIYMTRIAVDPGNPALIYAGSSQSWFGLSSGVYVSRDRGETWTNINANLGSALTVHGISVSPLDGTVWLATDYGNWRLHTTQTADWW